MEGSRAACVGVAVALRREEMPLQPTSGLKVCMVVNLVIIDHRGKFQASSSCFSTAEVTFIGWQ